MSNVWHQSIGQAMTLQALIPVLRIFDGTLAKQFYVDWLGFALDWEHQLDAYAPTYIQVSRDAGVLHLSEYYGDCSPRPHQQRPLPTP